MRYHILCLISLVCCGQLPSPQPSPPSPVVDDPSACGVAAGNIDKVCPHLSKTPAGKPFADFCKETQAKGVNLNTSCLATAADCAAANACIGSH